MNEPPTNPSKGSNNAKRNEPELHLPAPINYQEQNAQGNNVAEAFHQAFDEKMDGGKGLGHMQREWDGKFGSLPLYDNYDDESGSN